MKKKADEDKTLHAELSAKIRFEGSKNKNNQEVGINILSPDNKDIKALIKISDATYDYEHFIAMTKIIMETVKEFITEKKYWAALGVMSALTPAGYRTGEFLLYTDPEACKKIHAQMPPEARRSFNQLQYVNSSWLVTDKDAFVDENKIKLNKVIELKGEPILETRGGSVLYARAAYNKAILGQKIYKEGVSKN